MGLLFVYGYTRNNEIILLVATLFLFGTFNIILARSNSDERLEIRQNILLINLYTRISFVLILFGTIIATITIIFQNLILPILSKK